jgi:hypothetical protein
MKKIFFIPLEEIQKHFDRNLRQDVKIMVPTLWPNDTVLSTDTWKHSEQGESNNVFEAFLGDIGDDSRKLFSMSFVNEKAPQVEHYHEKHAEIYFSESPIAAHYISPMNNDKSFKKLEGGGSIIFGPGVVHKMELYGLTIVIEIPSVENDKKLIE